MEQAELMKTSPVLSQGELGLSEGGVPIGAALVRADGVVIGVGRNRRVQQGSATRHGEVGSSSRAWRASAGW
jgi:tRNA(Arg) A34 adenosine deaminase TadA